MSKRWITPRLEECLFKLVEQANKDKIPMRTSSGTVPTEEYGECEVLQILIFHRPEGVVALRKESTNGPQS